MNKSYALVWNQALGCWNVASELTRRRGKAGRGKVVIAAGVSLLGLLGQAPAFALPNGAAIVAGDATLQTSPDGKHMTIDQQSNKLITNWNEFSVGGNERVSFRQPGSASIALNRVIGTNGSDIQGRIDANGKVFLVNPNGVVFGKSAQVNVGGLVASTQNITDKDFLGGNYRFAGNSGAAISNAGTLTASEGGSVALLGAQVSNSGVVQARMGSVALGAGKDFSVNFDGNGLLNLQVNSGAVDALARNGGLLKADGGQVLMTARSADSLLKTVVSNQGVIEAKTLQNKSGRIVLDGGGSGIVRVAGRLDASALDGQGNGGVVETRGAQVEVQLATVVDTRADKGNTGTWTIRSKDVSIASLDGNNGGKTPTLRADTLSRNLDSTNIELTSSSGDLSVKAPVSWRSGNKLSLTAEHGDVRVDGELRASGDRASLALTAQNGSVRLNDNLALTGAGAGLALNYGKNGYSLKDGKAVTLSGTGATFQSNGESYAVIQNLAQLRGIDNGLSGRYVLGNRIAGNGARFRSLGDAGTFSGVFDGLGNTIDNLSIHGDGFIGLFSVNAGDIRNLNLDRISASAARATHYNAQVGTLAGVNLGSIFNVKATNVHVTGGSMLNSLGGLVAMNLQGGSIDKSSASGKVIGDSNTYAMGGLVALNMGNGNGVAKISNSQADVALAGQMQNGSNFYGAGGLVGVNRSAQILNSSSKGSVDLAGNGLNLGGLVGINDGGSLTNVESSASVSGKGRDGVLGGLVGLNNGGSLTNASASGKVAGAGAEALGGLIGKNQQGSVTNGSASGDVSDGSGRYLGGLIGHNQGGTHANVSASGSVSGGKGAYIGGLVGLNANGSFTNALASGKVTGAGAEAIGGLIGKNQQGSIANGSASGDVLDSKSRYVGGLIGHNLGGRHTNVSASGNVSGGAGAHIGGLVGFNESGSLNNASASGKVTGAGAEAIGGLIGKNLEGTLTNLTAKGDVRDESSGNVGGLIGYSGFATINRAEAYGKVTGGTGASVGGLIGFSRDGSIHGARADGAVTGGMGANAGGLIGYLDGGSVTASSASGDVAGGAGSHVGGLVGMNVGQISNASASGQVTSKAGRTLGGLVGWNSGSVSQSSASGKINPLGSGYTIHGGLIGVNFGRQSFNKVEGEAAKVPMMGLEFGI
ncbi:GLUG motif-containing protein [Cupriavidus basilensis]|uniref:GLUG motif-containing protein n=1 Tax=Cupriavidus basilensis TaxID=68895 RepID=A0ABT6B4F1_9BURK|nr:GLUG motif-containing protein [Cupriavidus basilensis]MDF3839688.1 GLUG motif-containing protein [Cupriavidus basilensis]